MDEDYHGELQELLNEQFIEYIKEATMRIEALVEKLRKVEEEHYEYFWG